MATKTTKTPPTEEVENVSVTESAPSHESVYTAKELADNHKVFGTYREIVVVALRNAGKETYTLSEAKKIIEDFRKQEVK